MHKQTRLLVLYPLLFVLLFCTACADGTISELPDAQQTPKDSLALPKTTLPQTPLATVEPANITPSAIPEPTAFPQEPFLAYVKRDTSVSSEDGHLMLLIDDVLWIDGEDEAALIEHGISPDEVYNDYVIYNEAEEWASYIATGETVFFVQYDFNYDLNQREVGLAEFERYLIAMSDDGILARITVLDGLLLNVTEIYTP